ncbi:hypothetical protein FH972_025847 [Carpinus fangiana]|uniref:RlpA-like protein double-psi beta-barrel domain-containing protein n=1 Tax=Carpinus fangiana TaxID=176857 RepID=A0A5N6L274_9ROSI|nr:hypothetical protein FH972_025847 [Carpinus fangiana]
MEMEAIYLVAEERSQDRRPSSIYASQNHEPRPSKVLSICQKGKAYIISLSASVARKHRPSWRILAIAALAIFAMTHACMRTAQEAKDGKGVDCGKNCVDVLHCTSAPSLRILWVHRLTNLGDLAHIPQDQDQDPALDLAFDKVVSLDRNFDRSRATIDAEAGAPSGVQPPSLQLCGAILSRVRNMSLPPYPEGQRQIYFPERQTPSQLPQWRASTASTAGPTFSIDRNPLQQHTQQRGRQPDIVPPPPPPKVSGSPPYRNSREQNDPTSLNYRSLHQHSRSNSRAESRSRSVSRKEPQAGTRRVSSTDTNHPCEPTRLSRWPTEPRLLRENNFMSKLFTAADIVMALVPVAFIVIGALAASLNGKPTADNGLGKNIEYAMRIGPTIFPIVFAGVVGRTMKVFARYAAQRGAKLGLLELLIASQSTWGTFENTLMMQRMTGLAATLMLLWAFSPLGGQASLRVLEKTTTSVITSRGLRYLNTGEPSMDYNIFASGTTKSNTTAANALLLASLLSSNTTLLGPRDAWSNVKIPRLDQLNASTVDADGWLIAADSMPAPESFSSLVGLPVVGLDGGLSSFNMESSYMALDCPPVQVIAVTPNKTTPPLPLGPLWQYEDYIPMSSTDGFSGPGGQTDKVSTDQYYSFFFDTSMPFNDGNSPRYMAMAGLPLNSSIGSPSLNVHRHITFASRKGPLDENADSADAPAGVLVWNCTIKSVHVESQVNCATPGQCAVHKMRKSVTDTRPETVSPLDQMTVAGNFFSSLQRANGLSHSGQSSPAEIFILNTSSSPFQVDQNLQDNYVNLEHLDPGLFGQRLSLLINTYFQLGQSPYAFLGNLPTDLTVYGDPSLNPMALDIPEAQRLVFDVAPMITKETNATVDHPFETYHTNTAWLVGLIVASSILLLVSLAGLLVKVLTIAPDIMGYVSSMTYHNPYVHLPPGGGPLDGMERARLLRDIRIKIADVKGSDEVGHVALVSVEDEGALLHKSTDQIKGASHSGDLTFYDVGQGSCGLTSSPGEAVVALSTVLMAPGNGGNPNNNPYCGKKININYNGKTTQATVVDTCMGCSADSIDVSNSLFESVAGALGQGRVHGVSWSFAD